MTEYILLGAMAAIIVLLMFLRTNTGIVFLALCSGTVLLGATGADASLFASSLSSGLAVSTDMARIGLLILPAITCAAFLRKQIPRHKLFFAAVPAIAIALLLVLLVVPLLSQSLQDRVGATDVWSLMAQYQSVVVAAGVAASIVTIAFTVVKPENGKGKHKKGKH